MEYVQMRKLEFILSLTLVIVMVIPLFAQETMTIDLNKSMVLALQNNENYQIARKELTRADARIVEAISSALPQITGNFNYLRNWEIPVAVVAFGDQTTTIRFGTNHSYTADLTATQPIYAGGRTFTALRIAKLAKHLSRHTLHQAEQELKVQVYNGYYGALLAQDVLKVNEEALKLAEDNLDVVQKLFNQGISAEFDLLRARVAVANLRPAVIKARDDADLALNAFRNLVGVSATTPLILVSESDSTKFVLPPIDPKAAEEEALKNRPEVQMSDYNTMISKQLISIASAGYRPSLYFSTSLQYQRQFDNGNVFDRKWNRSLFSAVSLSIPIFDSWRTPSQVKQAKITYQQGLLQDQSVHKGMILDLEQSLGRYLEARTRLSAQGDAVELARRGLDIANVRFESGVGTQLEVADARLSLSQAEINRAVAFHDLAVSYAALLRSLGRDINP
jgi:outer membrane protein